MLQSTYENNQSQFILSEISLISNRQFNSISAQQPDSTQASPPQSAFDTLANEFMDLEIMFRKTEDKIRSDIVALRNQVKEKDLKCLAMEKEIVQVRNQLKERKKDIAVLLSMLKKQEVGKKAVNTTTKRTNKSGQKSTSNTSKGDREKEKEKQKQREKVAEKKKSPKRQEIKERERQKEGNKSMRKIMPHSNKALEIER